jgi:hypothetical protein
MPSNSPYVDLSKGSKILPKLARGLVDPFTGKSALVHGPRWSTAWRQAGRHVRLC